LADARGTEKFDSLYEQTKGELEQLKNSLGPEFEKRVDSQLRVLEELNAPKQDMRRVAKDAIEEYISSTGHDKYISAIKSGMLDSTKKDLRAIFNGKANPEQITKAINKLNIDPSEDNAEKAQFLAAFLFSLQKSGQLETVTSNQELSLNIQGFLAFNGLQDLSKLFF